MSRARLANRDNIVVDFDEGLSVSGLQPELRIVRQVNIEAAEVAVIDKFANRLGKMNRGKGVARAAGSMSFTLVTATEMGRMLQAKYPGVYESRRKTISLHRRVARNYNQFVESRAQGIDDTLFGLSAMINALGYVDDALDQSADLGNGAVDEMPEVDELLWQDASFSPAGYGKFASSKLGLDLSNNETLLAEMEATRDFLRAEGLDVRVIDPERKPHVTVFETFAVLGKTSLVVPAPPQMVPLQPPHMLENTNQRTQSV